MSCQERSAVGRKGLGLAGGNPFQLDADRRPPPVGNCREGAVCLLCHWVSLDLENELTSDRSHLRSSIASVVQSPFLKLPFFGPRGAPGLRPPWRRHRL